MTEPKFIMAVTDTDGVSLVFDEPQTCPKCHVARCVWLRQADGTTTCFLCTPPPKTGETTSTEAT